MSSREILRWVLSLDLSYPVKNPRRDFANGFLFAEILSRYYPAEVQMHSFENVTSSERKKSNWTLLSKFLTKKQVPVEQSQITAVMAAEGEAAVEMLQSIYAFIHGPAYEATKQPEVVFSPKRAEELAQPRGRPWDDDAYTEHVDVSNVAAMAHRQGHMLQQAPAFIPSQPSYVQQPQQQYQLQQQGSYYGQQQQQQAGGTYMPQQPLLPAISSNGYSQGYGPGYPPAGYGSPQGPAGQEPLQGYGYPAAAAMPQQGAGHAGGRGRDVSPGAAAGGGRARQGGGGGGGGGGGRVKGSAPVGGGRDRSLSPGAQGGQAPSAARPRPVTDNSYSSPQMVAQMPAAVSPAHLAAAGYAAMGYAPQMGYAAAGAYGGYYTPYPMPPGYAAPAAGYGAAYASQQGPGLPAQPVAGGPAGSKPRGAGGSYAGGSSPAVAGGAASPAKAAGAGQGGGVGKSAAVGAAAAGAVQSAALAAYAQQAELARQQQEEFARMQEQYAAQFQAVLSPSGSGEDGYSAGGRESSPGRSGLENIPFAKPRPVEYQPYGQKDYEEKEYNVKGGKGYWELGRLGPDLETTELQAKREKAEKIKALAAQVREDNMKKAAVAAVKPKKEAPKELSARDKALQFAKNIPKPEPPKQPPAASAAAVAPAANGAGKRAPGAAGGKEGGAPAHPAAAAQTPSELELLEQQHAESQAKVEKIRAELARLL